MSQSLYEPLYEPISILDQSPLILDKSSLPLLIQGIKGGREQRVNGLFYLKNVISLLLSINNSQILPTLPRNIILVSYFLNRICFEAKETWLWLQWFKCKAHRLLAHNDSFHGLDLGHVVIVGPQLPLLNALVDPNKEVPRNVLTIVHPLS